VAIKPFAFEGKEQIARPGLTRIRADFLHGHFRSAAAHFRATSFGDKFQRAFFHGKIISAKMWP
jgi:hypothetical protein